MMLRSLRSFRRWLARRISRKKSLGSRGEDTACRYLKRQGYRIVARGYREGRGELDLVAVDRETVVFVEVKTRSSHDRGHPAEAVDARKQRQIVSLAQRYRRRHRLLDYPVRFDIVAVTWPEPAAKPHVEHFRSAFDAPDDFD